MDIVNKILSVREYFVDPPVTIWPTLTLTHFLDSPNWNQFIESEMFEVSVSVSVLRM